MTSLDSQVRLYWETARHLKPIQVWRRLRRPRPRLSGLDVRARVCAGRWANPLKRSNPWMGRKRWRILNQEREIETWNDSAAEKLWLYHLHYFEHSSPETVASWIDENPPGQGIGWEPYPLSRRIANWIAWLLESPLEPSARGVVERSVAEQAQWLSQSLEWHLLGNHLLANAKALVIAGAYFEGGAAESWLRLGAGILRQQLSEQILEDGGHFELSPMYHAIILEDLLDLVNLSNVYPGLLDKERESWREIAGRMLGWLRKLTHPDGQISYFNDSVQGVAPALRDLSEYAARLGITEAPIRLGSSGYVRLEEADTLVLFDAGPVGPDYQPGHGHCDLLSLEVSQRGRRVISNSGVSTYETCARRLAERKTAAHNTVCVDGVEQSEIWASFRVARRACVVERKTDGQRWAEAEHDGYRVLKGNVRHRRRVEICDGQVKVTDRLDGSGVHSAELFWHVSPGANPEIEFENGIERRVERGTWCAGFNSRVERPVVVGRWQGRLPATLVTHIRMA
jgi:uncharacterized heparinase superfamily protein